MAWSSTRNTLRRCSSIAVSIFVSVSPFGYRHGQPDLGAVPRFAADLRLAAVPLHPADDRAAYPVPVILHSGQVEAEPPVTDEHADLLGLHLRVQRYGLHLRVLGSIDHRLPRRVHQR